MQPIKATFQAKLETKTVWAGVYGGHYNQIVFFCKKPIKSDEPHDHIDGDWYDCGDNQDLIIGDMSLITFQTFFPDADLSDFLNENEKAPEIEISAIFQLELTAIWEDNGKLSDLSFHDDW